MAAGIVFKRIVSAMSNYADCDVFCPSIDEHIKPLASGLTCPSFKRYYYRIERWSNNHLGIGLSEVIWAKKAIRIIQSEQKKHAYDAILSFVYASNMAPLIIGREISAKLNLPWVVYTVDALPTPLVWNPNEGYYNKRLKFIQRYLGKSDALYAANPMMLRYIKNCLNNYVGLSGVVLTPCDESVVPEITPKTNKEIVFLYAGQIYPLRNIQSLFKGFELFLQQSINSKLIIVGSNKKEDFIGFEHLINKGRIERYGFTKNIIDFYQKADILIDVNADVENDVFLSSKVCNYLSYNKPIVVLSEDGAPVREMMSGYETIIHCHHVPNEISSALRLAVKTINYDFGERRALRQSFVPDAVAKCFCEQLGSLMESRKRSQ